MALALCHNVTPVVEEGETAEKHKAMKEDEEEEVVVFQRAKEEEEETVLFDRSHGTGQKGLSYQASSPDEVRHRG